MYRFDKKRDRFPVDQKGFLDLREAYSNGVVNGGAPIADESYNRASPDSMLNRPDDIFAAQRQQKYVRGTLKAQAEAEAKSEASVEASAN